MEGLSFQYPLWYLALCILLGLGFALFLYFRDQTFKEQSTLLKWALGIIRFTAVSILSMLLLSPFLKSVMTTAQDPIIIIAQDNSESVTAKMTDSQLEEYQSQMGQLASELEQNFDLQQYSFGSKVEEGISFSFDEKVTDISSFLGQMYDLYNNQNLGAIILATDGIYNQGNNPLYSSAQLNVPIFSIALGDTTAQKDLVLKNVFHNKIAYLGDKFVTQIDITAQNYAGSNTVLAVYKVDGDQQTKLTETSINIDKNDFFRTEEVILDASSVGVQRFRIVINSLNGEVSTRNNQKDILVDVLDARQKVLIIANAPHPDLSAIRQSLSENKNYEINVEYARNFTDNPSAYDFVILHQVPSKDFGANTLLKTIKEKNIPRLFIIGNQSNINEINRVQQLIRINTPGISTNEVQGKVANEFVAYTLSDQLRNEIPQFAPLTAPFGEFTTGANAQTLMYQRIGKIDTQYPLWVVGEDENTRVGVLCAEGIWKWRLFDFLQHQNQNIFNELMGKTVQYLGVKEDKRKFRVNLPKAIFNENENIVFDAELYNDNYELINTADASLVITDRAGKNYNFTFDKSDNAYRLNAGIFSQGNYQYAASVISNQKELSYSGQFSVEAIQLEVYETTADHRLLRLISGKYGGEIIYPNEIGQLSALLNETDKLKPVLYQTVQTQPLINLKWIFFILFGFLALEWFLRRYFGAY